ncbi:PAS domain S-box protein [Dechloromonas sp. H13]|uniref:PAS domain S-box protein n=1 Tax=Dechloromonas sp. H13 TaxID=2570193 RepID=UPI0012914469|nr:PAS domain S-box protein [Dechloromonas sp. H13]
MQETSSGKDKATATAASAPDARMFQCADALPSILENMLNGVAYCRMLYEDGVPQDFIYLYTNPAFHEQTGLGPVCGKRVSEVIPGIRAADPQLFEIYGRVAAGGQPEKFETFLESLQAWFAVQAYSPGPDHFVAVFDVITRRKQLDSELHLQALVLDQIQEQVTVTDLAGTVKYVNRAETEALASPGENRIGRHVSVYGDGPQADATQDEIVEATRRFGAWRGKVVNYRADGSPMLIDLRTSLVRDESGKPVAMVGVSTDITEQQVAEETLRASEERYRRLHESLLDAFAMVDMAGYILESNPAFQEMVGYSADELRHMTFFEMTPARWHEMEARIVAEQIIAEGHSDVYAKEYIRKDGTVFPVELRAFLVRDRDGRPEAMWAIVRDVTERKKTEERMQLAQQIFDNASEAIFVSDLQGNLLDVNAEACRLAKYTREEMLRLRNVDIVAQEETPRIAPELARCDAGDVVEQRWLLRCSDGSTVPLDLVVQRLPGDRYLAIGRDLTEREKVLRQLAQARDEAEKASRAKSRFLAAASHDLRQPILAINLFQDALGKTELSPEQRRIAEYLSRSAESLSGILSELLEISRFDSGTVQPGIGPVRAEDLFRSIDTEFSPLAGIKGLRFKFFFPQKGLVLLSDQKMLLNLLRNLIDNAFKYIEGGGVLVGIRSRGDRALIQVWDTGIGIAPEHIEAIFDEYFQVGNPQRDRAKGLGLGLAIVRRLARTLGCQVGCRSRPGKGSVFEFRLPLAGETTD